MSTEVLCLNDDSYSDDNNKNGNKENYIASPVPPIVFMIRLRSHQQIKQDIGISRQIPKK
jgi:hypothetical protein